MDVKQHMLDLEPTIIAWRREFHQYPELSYQEEKTVSLICEKLEEMAIPYQILRDRHGVIGILDSGRPGATVGLRADYDGLAVEETLDLEYKSKHPGMMHACGHDAHVAMVLGAGKALKDCMDEWSGRVLLIFQAAEEIGGGWEEVVEGLEALGGVDYLTGLHIWTLHPTGEIMLKPQELFCGGDGFRVTFSGQGGHGARPDLVRDPIKAACDMVLKLSSIPSNFYDVLDHSVVSVGQIHSGTAANIFPYEAYIEGTTRYYKPGGGDKIREHMIRMAKGVAAAYNVEADVRFAGTILPVYNEPSAIEEGKAAVAEMDDLKLHLPEELISGGDDFGMILNKYPGFYGVLGCRNEEIGACYAHHTTTFKIDEAALRLGSEFMVRYSLRCLAKGE